MELDEDKIDAAALAILALTLHDESRAWKGIDFDVMNRLHEKGLIHNPVGKTKSVCFTPEGLAEAKRQLQKHFAKLDDDEGRS